MFCLILLVLHLQPTLWLTVSSLPSSPTDGFPIAKPDCVDHCGNLSIPFPFGIGSNCCLDARYEIFCNDSSHPPKAFLQQHKLEVVDIGGMPSEDFLVKSRHILKVRIPAARNVCKSTDNERGISSIDLRGSPYRFSKSNIFVVAGCPGNVLMKDKSTGRIVTGCATVCDSGFETVHFANMNATNCYGFGCCKASLMSGITMGIEHDHETYASPDFYEIIAPENHIALSSSSNNGCALTASLMARESNIKSLVSDPSVVTVDLDWYFPLSIAHRSHHMYCLSDEISGFQQCHCTIVGNPYLPNACRAPDACRKCRSVYDCYYNRTISQYCCSSDPKSKRLVSIIGFSAGIGSVLLILASYWIYRLVKWRRDIKRKAKHFKKNGGLLLQQQMSSSDGVVEKITIFGTIDLEKATENFHESRILGQGGQGTVYKGMLMDGRTVAVKKSKKVDEGELDQFINEVVILGQINHRNVVKLLGCCLETEVPLLVYEFIPNGTLYDHIHDPTEDFHLSWKMRLQIAAESAGALAYLHSSSSAPVYHRDIKSSNILLDDRYRAKISDFGTSRAINIEQTHVTTRVQGTYGYLDPEYFQSNQFTEKSDVYSFGVVLFELITGKKPICQTESGGWKSLTMEFLSHMENPYLVLDIVDVRVIEEGKEEEFLDFANLVTKCLNMNGRLRPTMRQVSRILDEIRSPYSKDRIQVKGDEFMVTEIIDNGPSTSSSDMFFTQGSLSSL